MRASHPPTLAAALAHAWWACSACLSHHRPGTLHVPSHPLTPSPLSPPLTAALALVGNKTDLWEQREVSEEEGQAYADR